jgi:hypothetical protein
VPSLVIRAYAYDAPSRTLAVTFTNGRCYRYQEVPPETHEAMRAAFAKCEFFHRQIRDRYRYMAED